MSLRTRLLRPQLPPTSPAVSSCGREPEEHRHILLRFDRISGEECFRVAPIANGGNGCRGKHRRPAEHAEVSNRSVRGNGYVELHCSFNSFASCLNRICWGIARKQLADAEIAGQILSRPRKPCR